MRVRLLNNHIRNEHALSVPQLDPMQLYGDYFNTDEVPVHRSAHEDVTGLHEIKQFEFNGPMFRFHMF